MVLAPKHDKFTLRFGKLGNYIVSIIFTKAYYFDYEKQKLVEAIGVEKISCNILRVKKTNQGEKNEN